MLVLVPAHELLFGSLDRRYHHLRGYRSRTRHLLEKAGGEVRLCRYFNPVGALGWFIVTRIIQRERLTPSVVRLSEAVAVPVGRAIERLGDPPFGRSVLAVARRGMAHEGQGST